jgi:DNA modification methylase
VMEAFAAFGEDKGGNFPANRRGIGYTENGGGENGGTNGEARNMGLGTAARFFYCAKASRSERGTGNTHPTVKPLALMEWLVKLACPAGGTVGDPFTGSGTTAVACANTGRDFVGSEQHPGYFAIAQDRIATAQRERESQLIPA